MGRNVFARWYRPDPAPPAFGQGKVVPEVHASLLSRILFEWMSPILVVGFSRPIEKDDLWSLDEPRLAHTVGAQLENYFYARCAPEQRPPFLRSKQPVSASGGSSTIDVSSSREPKNREPDVEKAFGDQDRVGRETDLPSKGFWPFYRGRKTAVEEAKSKYDGSLLLALNSTFAWRFWPAGILKLVADTLNTTTPLVSKALITYLTTAYVYYRDPAAPAPPPIGHGIGLAFGLFLMQETASLCTNNYYQMTMVISAVFRKALRLSGAARLSHSSGQITTMISADATRLDHAAAFAHELWVAPIQIIIGIALLINNLGVSALVGLGVLIFGFPVQGLLVVIYLNARKKMVELTDRRVRVMQEVLQGIRVIKLFVWESFYCQKICDIRAKELGYIRTMALAVATVISAISFVPIAASIMSFITYALTNHPLNPAIIFSSLQYFNIIRAPLIMLPIVFSTCADAYVALGRVSKVLIAEELEDPYRVDLGSKYAVRVKGNFEWESAEEPKDEDKGGGTGGAGQDGEGAHAKGVGKDETKKQKGGKRKKEKKDKEKKVKEQTESGIEEGDALKPFALADIELKIPRGAFVAIIGKVGSGKSSLLQALVGEMRRTQGEVVFGGSTAYVPQSAWIMNATLRENILFGRDDDSSRFDNVVHACALNADLDMLPNGDMTEIGEKGINLSGGQKARVSLARAAYSGADIVLLDDPLSAVDAHVANHILENCLLRGPLADKTRILVTHALNVLPHVDQIIVMDNGKISEAGTYDDLMTNGQSFAELIQEFGSKQKSELSAESDADGKPGADAVTKGKTTEAEPALMQVEERNTGQVQWTVYSEYLRAAGGLAWGPALLLILAVAEGFQVGNNLFLGFWTQGSFPNLTQPEYMAVYAALGGGQAILSFLGSFGFSLAGLMASRRLFNTALLRVFRSPVSFYDTTPMGRIINRMSKDVDVVDNQLAQSFYTVLSTFSTVIGTVVLVFYTYAYLGIIFIPLLVLYYAASTFYRRTSVEVKRMDSILRSSLYASFSETLTGLATVRAYRQQDRFITSTQNACDVENRAYFMTIALQRWLTTRLDFLGNLLILGIGLFSVGFRNTVDPSKAGVVLSYTLSITQVFSQLVTQFAQNEQNMNAVERVEHYTTLDQEPASVTPHDPPPSWPSTGRVSFKNVELRYRDGLPLVLKGVSFEVKAGEKVGIVGRTGAGKTSVMQGLFRMVDICGGSINVDDVKINEIGLDILRRQLAVIPQDALLFQGTLRQNLDPTGSCTDAELLSALQRAWLLPQAGTTDPSAEAKFSLDAVVTDEGANFSAGERQLVALCRALVKNSKIIVLDEATSSVDVSTDSKLQLTIQREFQGSTLLCIAHRLNTIVHYDRILVLHEGTVAEYDTPLVLFDRPQSIFRSTCDKAGLSRQDIEKIRASGPGRHGVLSGPSSLSAFGARNDQGLGVEMQQEPLTPLEPFAAVEAVGEALMRVGGLPQAASVVQDVETLPDELERWSNESQ